jgi:MFS transporter, ACS family, D-galactonate transporter
MNRVLFLLGLSIIINYIDRSNLSIAAPLIKNEMGITASQLGMLLSAFFWTYSLMQICSGWLVDRFDVKWVFAAGFFVWSAATAVTGWLHGFVALLAARVLLGVGEAVSFPSNAKILGSYFDENRRGYANSIVLAGLALGPAIGLLLGGSIVARFGWRPFFVVVGLAGLVWLLPWFAWMPRREVSAAVHSPISDMLKIIRRLPAWGMWACHFSLAYPLYFLLTWLPFYLTRVRGLSLNQMARVGALVFLVQAATTAVAGRLSDYWIVSGGDVTRVRKSLVIAGSIIEGICLVAAVLSPSPYYVWMLAIAGFCMGLKGPTVYAAGQTIPGPRMVGRWMGLQQCVGNLSGVVAPAVTGYLVDRTHSFHWPFFLAAGISWLGILSWMFAVGPIQTMEW